jgi:glycosyltransferase involved in cell wall biosynthesis
MGHQVTVISTTVDSSIRKPLISDKDDVTFLRLYKLPGRLQNAEYYSFMKIADYKLLRKFFRININEYDIIFVEGLLETLPRRSLKHLRALNFQNRTVCINHGIAEADYDIALHIASRLLHGLIGGYLLKTYTHVVVFSDFTRNQLVSNLRITERGNISKIMLGIDISNFKKLYLDVSSHKTQINVETQKYILAIGRQHRIKGYDLLIKAFYQLIKDTGENIDLVIAGSRTEFTKTLEEIIKTYQLTGRVQLLDRITEETKLSLMLNCTIFVIPSRREGYGINSIEASILGLPIVATNVGAHSEILKTYKYRVIVSPDSVQELYEGIRFMLDQPKKIPSFDEKRASEYDIRETASELLKLGLQPSSNASGVITHEA